MSEKAKRFSLTKLFITKVLNTFICPWLITLEFFGVWLIALRYLLYRLESKNINNLSKIAKKGDL